ncbi:MAG: glycogen/starch/alpha-glucan phosphorylase [Lachnospiraceae bacterium]
MSRALSSARWPRSSLPQGPSTRRTTSYGGQDPAKPEAAVLFLVPATAQTIVKQHRKQWGDVRSFAEHHVIHIKRHPSHARRYPSFMRIFMDEDGSGPGTRLRVVSNCVAYTNHTTYIMSESA